MVKQMMPELSLKRSYLKFWIVFSALVFGHYSLEALRQHLSQHPDVPAMEAYVRAQSVEQGAKAGFTPGALAEAFHVVAVNAADTIAGF